MLPVTPSSKSFVYTKNKTDPSTDPWDTPLKTGFQLETSPSTTSMYTYFYILPIFLLQYNTLTTFHIHVYLFMYDFYYVNINF